MEEIWKPIPLMEGYEASSLGRIKRRGKIARNFEYPNRPYITFCFCKNQTSLHRAVCMAFHGMPENEKLHASHLDGNSKNNKAENLAWKTCKENHADKNIHGTMASGEKNGAAKIKKQDVLEMFTLYAKGYSFSQLAEKFKIAKQSICKIILRQRWAHVPIPEGLIEICCRRAIENIKSANGFKANG